MNVTLNVNNDEELRLWIKDLIRGQIKSVVRDEIKLIIQETVNTKIEKVSAIANIDKEIKDVIDQKIRNSLNLNHSWNEDFIKKTTRELITAKVGEVLKKM
jgi:uncharacterized membrane protein